MDGVYHRPPPDNQRAVDPDEIADPRGRALGRARRGMSLVVIRTPPGEANRVAVALDRIRWPVVVGTIAGDDTIFVATQNKTTQQRILAQVRRLAGS